MLSESALSKKRQFAEERAARLRDARVRCLGIDKTALDEQVAERKAMESLENDRDKFFDQQRLLMDKHAVVLEREMNHIRAQRDKELEDYRRTFQAKHASREWDLNDPKRVVGSLPARVGDNDLRLGPSSLQKFEGEDLDFGDRKRLQQQQQRNWVQQQTDERLMKKWMEQDGHRKYEDRAEEMAHRTWQIENSIAQQRRQISETNAAFNKAVADQKRQETLRSRFDNTAKNLEEIHNMMSNDLLIESTGPGFRKRADYKGMSREENKQILHEQATQREQLQQRRLHEAEDEKRRDTQELMQVRMAMTLDRQRERERRNAAQALGEEHKKQANEARDRKKHLDNLYENAIGEEYFVYGKCL